MSIQFLMNHIFTVIWYGKGGIMSINKKYFYIKLKDTFFDSEEMKLLEMQKNGIHYQVLYLKMCLHAAKTEGKLLYKDLIPYTPEMISQVLNVNIDMVRVGIKVLQQMGLIEILDTGAIYIMDMQLLIGKSSTEAERKKAYRLKIAEEKKLLNNNGHDTVMIDQNTAEKWDICPPNIEIEIEIENPSGQMSLGESFSVFWKAYDKPIEHDRCLKYWRDKIDPELYPSITSHAKKYSLSTEKQFRKNPINYLKGKCWEDEIITKDSDFKRPIYKDLTEAAIRGNA